MIAIQEMEVYTKIQRTPCIIELHTGGDKTERETFSTDIKDAYGAAESVLVSTDSDETKTSAVNLFLDSRSMTDCFHVNQKQFESPPQNIIMSEKKQSTADASTEFLRFADDLYATSNTAIQFSVGELTKCTSTAHSALRRVGLAPVSISPNSRGKGIPCELLLKTRIITNEEGEEVLGICSESVISYPISSKDSSSVSYNNPSTFFDDNSYASPRCDIVRAESTSEFEVEKSASSVSSSSSCSSVSTSRSPSSASHSSKSFSTMLDQDDSDYSSIVSSATNTLYVDDTSAKTNFTLKALKMQKKFELRDRELRRLSMNNKNYHQYLQDQEKLAREHSTNRLSYLRLHSKMLKENVRYTVEHQELTTMGENSFQNIQAPKRKLSNILLFECYHSMPGVFSLVMYVVAHTSCYEFFYHAHSEAFYWASNYWGYVYGWTFLIGLLLLRLSGGLFSWTNEETYEGAKFDMHNKIRLQDMDAKLMRWLRQKKSLRVIVDIFAVYMCFISVGYFTSEKFLPAVCGIRQSVYEGLPSHKYGVKTYLHDVLKKDFAYQADSVKNVFVDEVKQQLFSFVKTDQCIKPPGDSFEILRAALEEADAEYLYNTVSKYSFYGLYGWEKTPVVSGQCYQAFHFINSMVSMVTLFKMGVGFWDE